MITNQFDIDMRVASRLRVLVSTAAKLTGQRHVTVLHGQRRAGAYVHRNEQFVIDVQPMEHDRCRVTIQRLDGDEEVPK